MPVPFIQEEPPGTVGSEEANWDNASQRFPDQNKTVDFGQRTRPLYYRYNRTDTCGRFGMAVTRGRYKFVITVPLLKRPRNSKRPFQFRNRHLDPEVV
jgi:hypothetical protein